MTGYLVMHDSSIPREKDDYNVFVADELHRSFGDDFEIEDGQCARVIDHSHSTIWERD